MIQKTEIPELAICHKCGEPMKVIDLTAKAAKLGVQVPEGSFSIECCGSQLTIEDDAAAERLKDLLLAYHDANRVADD